MPRLAWFEGDLKAEPPVGVHRLCRRMRRGDCHRAAEVAVAVGRAQMLARFRPIRGDAAATHNAARLHLKDIGEVAAQRDLELELHRPHAVVRDVEVG